MDPLQSHVAEALGAQYEILRELGRGGMAVVYLAREKALDREVALKVLPPQFTFDQEFVRRFQREARTAAGLEHPQIIPIYAIGEEGGIAYFTMRYVRGGALSGRIRTEGALSTDEIVRVGQEICAALGYAHARGVIHRDVKPDNILFDEMGSAVVTDFGIARAATGTRLTATGTSIGTPHYMSPEQVRGQGVDARSDLYSLGIVLYEMATGSVPFRGEDPTAVTHAQIYEAPDPPRVRKGDVPAWLDTVILKCLAKEPEDRFQSAEELGEALRTWKEAVVPRAEAASSAPSLKVTRKLEPQTPEEPKREEPTSSGKKPASSPMGVKKRRLSGRLWLVVGVVVALAVGGFLIVQGLQRQAEQRRLVERQRQVQLEAEQKKRAAEEARKREEERLRREALKDMVFIPGGTFRMGSNDGGSDEKPVHTVTVRGFYMDKYEVTNTQYRRFDSSHNSKSYKGHSLNGDSQPVVYVSWWDVIKYCNGRSRREELEKCYNESTGVCDFSKNGYRLPTEAEWEYAARGGLEGKKYPWGNSDVNGSQCNFSDKNDPSGPSRKNIDDGYAVTAPVGSFSPNGYGLYDMAGNVWEWCSDWYSSGYYSKSSSSNPSGANTGTYRVLRGGSWRIFAFIVRCAIRNRNSPDLCNDYSGFRCVRTP